MIKVQFLRGTFAPGGTMRRVGEVADLDPTLARDLIRMGKAAPVGAVDQKTADAVAEAKRRGKSLELPKPAKAKADKPAA